MTWLHTWPISAEKKVINLSDILKSISREVKTNRKKAFVHISLKLLLFYLFPRVLYQGYAPVVRGLMATSYRRVGEKMSIDQKNIMQTYYLDDFNGCPIKKVVGELQDIFTPTPSFPLLNIQDHPLQISNQIFAFLRPSPSPPNFEYPILSAPTPPPKFWIVIRSLLYHFLSHGTAVRMSVPYGISRLHVVTT